MPVTYRIYEDIGLVHVRYEGKALLQESFEAVGRYLRDPGFRPGQKQLVDLSGVTAFEEDYARLMALQAKKAEAFFEGPENLIVYLAPTEITRTMARIVVRSWRDIDAVVPVVVETEAEALEVLGLADTSLDDLAKRPV